MNLTGGDGVYALRPYPLNFPHFTSGDQRGFGMGVVTLLERVMELEELVRRHERILKVMVEGLRSRVDGKPDGRTLEGRILKRSER